MERDLTLPEGAAWIGRVIDQRYRIEELLGEGGMGTVFVAEHLQLQKRVALKTIHGQFADNREMAARFAREAMTSAHIEHPNVVSALDFGELAEGGAYLVMQLVRGPSLRDHLEAHGALAWPEACRLMAQVADALVAAHGSGIVHRDLKPENVLLVNGEDGLPMAKVLDFGIAHVTAKSMAPPEAGKPLTQVGVVIGTPGYMPPEQATGQPVDERADLYALGVMLWELVMGRGPFAAPTFSEIFTKQITSAAPELEPAGRAAPAELRALVRSLLETAPAKRPASALPVRDALRALAQQATAGDAASLRWLRESGDGVSKALIQRSTRFVRAMPQHTRWAAGIVGLSACVVAFLLLRGPSAAESSARDPAALQAEKTATEATRPKVAKPSAEPVRPKPAEPVVEVEAVEAPEVEAEPSEAEAEAKEANADAEDKASASGQSKRTRRAKAQRSEESGESKPARKKPVQRLKRALNELFD
jgi:serine/threonine protein kinase